MADPRTLSLQILQMTRENLDNTLSDWIARNGADSGSWSPGSSAEESGLATGRAQRLVGDAMGIPKPENTDESVRAYFEQIDAWASSHSAAEVEAALDRAIAAAQTEAATAA
jgi:hypothetical protein